MLSNTFLRSQITVLKKLQTYTGATVKSKLTRQTQALCVANCTNGTGIGTAKEQNKKCSFPISLDIYKKVRKINQNSQIIRSIHQRSKTNILNIRNRNFHQDTRKPITLLTGNKILKHRSQHNCRYVSSRRDLPSPSNSLNKNVKVSADSDLIPSYKINVKFTATIPPPRSPNEKIRSKETSDSSFNITMSKGRSIRPPCCKKRNMATSGIHSPMVLLEKQGSILKNVKCFIHTTLPISSKYHDEEEDVKPKRSVQIPPPTPKRIKVQTSNPLLPPVYNLEVLDHLPSTSKQQKKNSPLLDLLEKTKRVVESAQLNPVLIPLSLDFGEPVEQKDDNKLYTKETATSTNSENVFKSGSYSYINREREIQNNIEEEAQNESKKALAAQNQAFYQSSEKYKDPEFTRDQDSSLFDTKKDHPFDVESTTNKPPPPTEEELMQQQQNYYQQQNAGGNIQVKVYDMNQQQQMQEMQNFQRNTPPPEMVSHDPTEIDKIDKIQEIVDNINNPKPITYEQLNQMYQEQYEAPKVDYPVDAASQEANEELHKFDKIQEIVDTIIDTPEPQNQQQEQNMGGNLQQQGQYQQAFSGVTPENKPPANATTFPTIQAAGFAAGLAPGSSDGILQKVDEVKTFFNYNTPPKVDASPNVYAGMSTQNKSGGSTSPEELAYFKALNTINSDTAETYNANLAKYHKMLESNMQTANMMNVNNNLNKLEEPQTSQYYQQISQMNQYNQMDQYNNQMMQHHPMMGYHQYTSMMQPPQMPDPLGYRPRKTEIKNKGKRIMSKGLQIMRNAKGLGDIAKNFNNASFIPKQKLWKKFRFPQPPPSFYQPNNQYMNNQNNYNNGNPSDIPKFYNFKEARSYFGDPENLKKLTPAQIAIYNSIMYYENVIKKHSDEINRQRSNLEHTQQELKSRKENMSKNK